jgi:alpha-tubulin suppressor-like RCC1 family protein
LLLVSCVALKTDPDHRSDDAGDDAGDAPTVTGSTMTWDAPGPWTASSVTTQSAAGPGGAGGAPAFDAADGAGAGGSAGRGLDIEGGTGGVQQLASASAHTCALLSHGGVRCWGWGAYGVLGYKNEDDVGDDETPASVGDVNVGGKVTQIAASSQHTCALLEGGRVRCWGSGTEGALGYGNYDSIGDNETPADAGDVEVGGKVVQLATGMQHVCALLDTGAVRCWGEGGSGQLGYARIDWVGVGDKPYEKPYMAGEVYVGGKVVELAAGGNNTCARLESGAVRCWGSCNYGQCGYGNTKNIGDDETPAWAGNIDLGGTATQIAVASQSVCAVLTGGRLRCWGMGENGLLGYGKTDAIGDNELPSSAGDVDVGGTVMLVRCGDTHCCAVLEGGALRCWGRNAYGELGYGHTRDIGDNETPASAGDVRVGGPVVDVAPGQSTTCALLVGGTVRCWGVDGSGELGYGRPLGGPIGDDEYPESAGDVPVY